MLFSFNTPVYLSNISGLLIVTILPASAGLNTTMPNEGSIFTAPAAGTGIVLIKLYVDMTLTGAGTPFNVTSYAFISSSNVRKLGSYLPVNVTELPISKI
jgi:hypothetical protein